jgi:hypothetical protein
MRRIWAKISSGECGMGVPVSASTRAAFLAMSAAAFEARPVWDLARWDSSKTTRSKRASHSVLKSGGRQMLSQLVTNTL